MVLKDAVVMENLFIWGIVKSAAGLVTLLTVNTTTKPIAEASKD
jgi:hypothetical protein